jgi:hypothetical protein
MNEHFKNQIEQGAEIFFYGIERELPFTVSIMRHKGSLDTFPANLEYVCHLTDDWPLFKEVQ